MTCGRYHAKLTDFTPISALAKDWLSGGGNQKPFIYQIVINKFSSRSNW